MSSYHPVISQDFNPLKTTMGHVEDDIPNESALYRQINQTGSDMQYRVATSDRNSAQFRQNSEKEAPYAQMTAAEKAYKGLSAQASNKILKNQTTENSKSTISDEELSDYSSSMDLNNAGRYQQKEARPIAGVRENKYTAHQVLSGQNTTPTPQQKMIQMQAEHVNVRQFNEAPVQRPTHAMISDDSDTSSLSSSSGSIVSGTVTGTDMESSLTQSIDSSTIQSQRQPQYALMDSKGKMMMPPPFSHPKYRQQLENQPKQQLFANLN
jgi:hypothetical protein